MATREQVLTSLETLAASAASVKYSTRQVVLFEDLPTNIFPLVQVIDNGDIEVLHKTGGVATVSIDVQLKIVTKAEYKDNATKLNMVDSEIIAALYTDLRLGGGADLVEILDREAEEIETTHPFVVVTRNIVLHYTGSMATGL